MAAKGQGAPATDAPTRQIIRETRKDAVERIREPSFQDAKGIPASDARKDAEAVGVKFTPIVDYPICWNI